MCTTMNELERVVADYRSLKAMLPDTFFDRINEIYLYQMQRKYGKKLKWKLANKLIKSMAR